MDVKLTQGAVEAMFGGSVVTNPVLQLLAIRKLTNDSSAPRYRLIMSDGVHSQASFLLASEPEENLVPNCVCMLTRTKVDCLRDGRPVVIVLEMEIVKSAEEIGGKIGHPTTYYLDGTTSPQKPASTPPVPASPPVGAVAGPSHKYSSAVSSPKDWGKEFAKKTPMGPTKFSPTASPTKTVPISSLNPYQSKWTIKARVMNKSDVRTWSNSRGEGKLFSFEVLDDSGEIRITAFNKEVDKFFSLVEQGKVYYISKATLKPANKQYTRVKNDYEMTLHSQTSIVPCSESDNIPMVQYDFVPIAELEIQNKDAIIDVIGVCTSAEDVSRITTRTSREVSKRALQLMDTSGKVVTVALWGQEAEKFDGSGQPVIAIKGARLSDFGGISLSVLSSSTVTVNPDIPQAFRLRAWYDQKGCVMASQSLTQTSSLGSGSGMNWKTLSDIKDEHMGHGEKADYFSCVATVVYIRKENCLYQSCPSGDCKKKVIDQHNGLYRCEKCNREFPNFKYRLLLIANLADFGDNQWVTCFEETAEVLLGHNAVTLGHLRDTDEDAFDEVFQKVNFSNHIFKNRVKMETYNDEGRVRVTVMDIQPINHRDYSRRLLSNIRKLAIQASSV